MNKFTPYSALCELFRTKIDCNNDLESEITNTEEQRNKVVQQNYPEEVQTINNSCQTQAPRDYSFDTIQTARKCQKKSDADVCAVNITLHDDNFRILRPDYAAYSGGKPYADTPPAKTKVLYTQTTKTFQHGRSFTPLFNRKKRQALPAREVPPKCHEFKTKKVDNQTSMRDSKDVFQERITQPSNQNRHRYQNKINRDNLDVFPELNLYRRVPIKKRNINEHTPIQYKDTPFRKSNHLIHSSFKNTNVNALYKTYSDLKEAFENKYNHCPNNNEEKCLCDHCGALSVVNESLKHPMIYNPNEEEGHQYCRKRRRKSNRNKHEENEYIELSKILKNMQERIHELEETKYVQGPIKTDNSNPLYNLHTQCDNKKKKTKFESLPRSFLPKKFNPNKMCPLSFTLPLNLRDKIFGRKSSEERNPKSDDTDSENSDNKVYHVSRSQQRKQIFKPKLRCHEYMSKKKQDVGTSAETSFLRSSSKTYNVNITNGNDEAPTKGINREANRDKKIHKILLQLNTNQISPTLESQPIRLELKLHDTEELYKNNQNYKYTSHSSEELDVKFSKNTSTQYESLSNEVILKNSIDCEYFFLKTPEMIEKLVKMHQEPKKFQRKPHTVRQQSEYYFQKKPEVIHEHVMSNNIFQSSNEPSDVSLRNSVIKQQEEILRTLHAMNPNNTEFYSKHQVKLPAGCSSVINPAIKEITNVEESAALSITSQITSSKSWCQYINKNFSNITSTSNQTNSTSYGTTETKKRSRSFSPPPVHKQCIDTEEQQPKYDIKRTKTISVPDFNTKKTESKNSNTFDNQETNIPKTITVNTKPKNFIELNKNVNQYARIHFRPTANNNITAPTANNPQRRTENANNITAPSNTPTANNNIANFITPRRSPQRGTENENNITAPTVNNPQRRTENANNITAPSNTPTASNNIANFITPRRSPQRRTENENNITAPTANNPQRKTENVNNINAPSNTPTANNNIAKFITPRRSPQRRTEKENNISAPYNMPTANNNIDNCKTPRRSPQRRTDNVNNITAPSNTPTASNNITNFITPCRSPQRRTEKESNITEPYNTPTANNNIDNCKTPRRSPQRRTDNVNNITEPSNTSTANNNIANFIRPSRSPQRRTEKEKSYNTPAANNNIDNCITPRRIPQRRIENVNNVIASCNTPTANNIINNFRTPRHSPQRTTEKENITAPCNTSTANNNIDNRITKGKYAEDTKQINLANQNNKKQESKGDDNLNDPPRKNLNFQLLKEKLDEKTETKCELSKVNKEQIIKEFGNISYSKQKISSTDIIKNNKSKTDMKAIDNETNVSKIASKETIKKKTSIFSVIKKFSKQLLPRKKTNLQPTVKSKIPKSKLKPIDNSCNSKTDEVTKTTKLYGNNQYISRIPVYINPVKRKLEENIALKFLEDKKYDTLCQFKSKMLNIDTQLTNENISSDIDITTNTEKYEVDNCDETEKHDELPVNKTILATTNSQLVSKKSTNNSRSIILNSESKNRNLATICELPNKMQRNNLSIQTNQPVNINDSSNQITLLPIIDATNPYCPCKNKSLNLNSSKINSKLNKSQNSKETNPSMFNKSNRSQNENKSSVVTECTTENKIKEPLAEMKNDVSKKETIGDLIYNNSLQDVKDNYNSDKSDDTKDNKCTKPINAETKNEIIVDMKDNSHKSDSKTCTRKALSANLPKRLGVLSRLRKTENKTHKCTKSTTADDKKQLPLSNAEKKNDSATCNKVENLLQSSEELSKNNTDIAKCNCIHSKQDISLAQGEDDKKPSTISGTSTYNLKSFFDIPEKGSEVKLNLRSKTKLGFVESSQIFLLGSGKDNKKKKKSGKRDSNKCCLNCSSKTSSMCSTDNTLKKSKIKLNLGNEKVLLQSDDNNKNYKYSPSTQHVLLDAGEVNKKKKKKAPKSDSNKCDLKCVSQKDDTSKEQIKLKQENKDATSEYKCKAQNVLGEHIKLSNEKLSGKIKENASPQPITHKINDDALNSNCSLSSLRTSFETIDITTNNTAANSGKDDKYVTNLKHTELLEAVVYSVQTKSILKDKNKTPSKTNVTKCIFGKRARKIKARKKVRIKKNPIIKICSEHSETEFMLKESSSKLSKNELKVENTQSKHSKTELKLRTSSPKSSQHECKELKNKESKESTSNKSSSCIYSGKERNISEHSLSSGTKSSTNSLKMNSNVKPCNLRRLKNKIGAKLSCKYLVNLCKHTPIDRASRSLCKVMRTYITRNFCDLSNKDIDRMKAGSSGKNMWYCNAAYYNWQNLQFDDRQSDDGISYTDEDYSPVCTLTQEEKRCYLLEKLYLLQNFRDRIHDEGSSSNYGTFE